MKTPYMEAIMSVVEWAAEDVIRTSQEAPWMSETEFESETVDVENDLPWDVVD